MKEKILVTVFVLIYKDLTRITELLESIVNQTYENIELLVSDDGSPNITKGQLEELVEPYKNRFKNIIINKNERNCGTVRHLNGVLLKANGEILSGLAPGDIFYDSNVIESVVDYFKKNREIDIVTSKRYEESEKAEYPIKKVQNIIKNDFKRYQKIMFRATPLISGAGTFYRKELFDKFGYFPEEFKLVEDASFYTKLISEGVCFGYLDKVTLWHGAGGVSDRNATPHPWYVEDMDFLYSTWLYRFIPQNDFFSHRCITYHCKRRQAESKCQILYLYLCYIDVCAWFFWFYREEIIKKLGCKVKGFIRK